MATSTLKRQKQIPFLKLDNTSIITESPQELYVHKNVILLRNKGINQENWKYS